ncbi:tRNA lysidine(34) synthetase TilS [Acidisoma cellulosilytica]|uniref:tRNA(Ile)-lysidine synthase n=1 Tax=Acidisoma cellulosilyticum TaxID=2802395 RepID=A0A964E6Z0_9PROT|nr:tRNA lysidine(34) synthetase TilS [Acidisoma cellulosilyticum]MCB8883488.1 tRNA lysidine(34) synthetase TilS [Acidisoma cellulosilyticum]
MLTRFAPDNACPQPLSAAEFSSLLRPLGPFGHRPLLGLAVSGGADSLALALLAQHWAQDQDGGAEAFVVDHGLRADSRSEAESTAQRLSERGIATRILPLSDLKPGPGISDRARGARYRALAEACGRAGIVHLLLGHHAADQAETLIMRSLRGSGDSGLAGMAAVAETGGIRLLRPLLTVPPGRLRATLRAAGLDWAEDPTNADTRFTRARLRGLRADGAGNGPATRALTETARLFGLRRAESDQAIAGFLADYAVIRPEGFMRITADGSWPAAALAQALRMITGADYPAGPAAIARIAADPSGSIGRGLVLGGARLLPAGRLGTGFLVCREAAAMAPPVPALAGAVWDGRFRMPAGESDQPGEMIAPLGTDAARFRRVSDLPAVVLRTLACFRNRAGDLLAVPALSWAADGESGGRRLLFAPAVPAAGAPFFPAPQTISCSSAKKMTG